MADHMNQHRCSSCHSNYSSRKVLLHHLLMVHEQRLPYTSARRHVRPHQLQKGAGGIGTSQGGREERRRGLQAREEERRKGLQARMGRMGPAPPGRGTRPPASAGSSQPLGHQGSH